MEVPLKDPSTLILILMLDFIAQNFDTDTRNLPTHRILTNKNPKHKLTSFQWAAIINLTNEKPITNHKHVETESIYVLFFLSSQQTHLPLSLKGFRTCNLSIQKTSSWLSFPFHLHMEMFALWLHYGIQKCLASVHYIVLHAFVFQLILLHKKGIYENLQGFLWFSCQQRLVAK